MPLCIEIGNLQDAVSLATSTAVRLLPENSVINNHKYFVLCTGAPFVRRPTTVLWCEERDCACTAENEGFLCFRHLRNIVRSASGESNVFLMHQSFTSLALLIATTLVAGFFAYIHRIKRQTYLLLWTAAWAVFALHYVGPTLAPWAAANPLQSALNHWLFALSGVLFFLGTQLYSQRKAWKIPGLAVGILFGLWAAANAANVISISAIIPGSLLYIAVAVVFWQESRRQETLADRLLGVSFASWGALWIALHILDATPELQGAGMSVVAAAPCAFVSMLMVMALYEEEKRRIERNMLALSNLNLATSSFVGGEIQRMLSQALDRVLGVVRLPAGALFLHHGDPQGPTSVVAVGLSEEFCRVAQNENLDDYLVSLVARLGGLLGFRDLRDDSLSALEKEQSIRRFRQLALAHGLRSVVAISLQAKEQAFGVLLLGTPDSRRFTAAELRLLLALGHQIGMAVENSYLIQQSARRTEELHMLNEIGRALSSTLDPEALFETILSELKRLVDVSHFYIALHDAAHNEIRFEIEIHDGVTQPKRSRPFGEQHVTEYVMRTRQPLLIRENYAEELRKIGLISRQDNGCFCGVPLLLYERVIGVMAVQSPQEGAFDAGHLEMMRVVASEAVIALENARLFREERAKSRHLTLLNNISRNVITTLNPDEMLAKIAEELEQGLDYSHIGIGLLDYSSKEIVIQAEAGQRKG